MLYGWTTKSGCTTPTSQDQPSNVHLQRSGGELLLENTQHDGDAFFEAEKVTLTLTIGTISHLERTHVWKDPTFGKIALVEKSDVWKDTTFVKISTFFDAGEVGRPSLQTEALLHNGGQDELDAQGLSLSASDALLS